MFKDPEVSGKYVAHAVSGENDFPLKVEDHEDSPVADAPDEAAKTDEVSLRYQKVFEDFSGSMMGFLEMLPLVAGIGHSISRAVATGAMKSYVSRHGEMVDSDEGREIFKLHIGHYPTYDNINLKRENAGRLGRRIPTMLVLGIVSSFEHHLSMLLGLILENRPAIINAKKIELTLEDILSHKDIDSVKYYYISQQVESVMRDSFSVQISMFEKYIGINKEISKNYPNWDDLVEIFERRNLFAHADGIVNGIYLSNVKSSKRKIGDVLSVSPAYFSKTIENLFEFGAKLFLVAWRRQCTGDTERIDGILSDFCYDLVEARQYRLASRLLEFGLSDAEPKKAKTRMTNKINLANCYRLMKQADKSNEVLDTEDWSGAGDEFQMCVAAIRGDLEKVIQFMRTMPEDKVKTHSYENWPVFYKLRDDDRFSVAFEEIFGRPYSPAGEDRHSFMQLMSLVQEDEENATLTEQDGQLPLEIDTNPPTKH